MDHFHSKFQQIQYSLGHSFQATQSIFLMPGNKQQYLIAMLHIVPWLVKRMSKLSKVWLLYWAIRFSFFFGLKKNRQAVIIVGSIKLPIKNSGTQTQIENTKTQKQLKE